MANRFGAFSVRLIIGMVTIVGVGLIALVEQPQPAAAHVGPGGALALKPGPKDVRGYVRVIDGDTIDVTIDDQRVAVGLIGVRTPQANTDCGLEATKRLKSLVKGGLRLEEDTTLAIDGRLRRMYRAVALDGRSIADDLIGNGFTKSDGKGDHSATLNFAETDARTAAQGCIWKNGLPTDLRGPSFAPPDPEDQQSLLGARPVASAFGLMSDAMGALRGSLQPQVAEAQGAGLLPNFTQDTLANTGLNEPTNLAFLPDGRILIPEKHGIVRMFKNGAVLTTPFIDIHDRVNDYFDHGLIGIAVDPNFAVNNYVYLLYTYENDINQYSNSKTGRLARYTASGDTASVSSEFVVLGHWVGPSCQNFPAGYDCIPSDNLSHSVGTMRFAADGSMYVTSGDGASFSVVDPLALRAQDLASLGGKILHIDPATGNGFTTNPFYNGDATANRAKVWDYGLRNPYRFGIRPSNNVPYIGQVGWNTYEDIYVGKPGKNFGWPCYEGNFVQDGYSAYAQCQSLYSANTRTPPLLSYVHYGGSTAITAGFFYQGTNFPASYVDRFFYADYGHGWINSLQTDANDNLVANSVATFVTEPNAGAIVALHPGLDGYLYYVSIVNPSALMRIRYIAPNSPPTAVASSNVTNGLLPLTVQFSSAGTSDPNGRPLTYSWDFGDGATSTAANPSHAYTTAGTYTAKLTVTNNVPASASDSVVITAGSRPPTASITSPTSALLYKVGDTINFSGSGTDYNGAAIPPSGLSWQVIVHHCPQGSCHTHFLQTATGNGGSIVVPDHGDDVYLELQLTATNSAGLSTMSSVSIHPLTVTLAFDSVPTGLTVVYDGASGTTPRTQVTTVNSQHTLYAPSPQVQGGATFSSWSDGGAQQHNIIVPATNNSYVPTFNVTQPSPRSLRLTGGGYAETLVSPPLNILGDWTFETWFKDTDPAGYHHGDTYLAIKGDTNGAGESPYLMGISWNNLFAGVRTGYSTYTLSYDLVAAGVTANAWHHMAATFQASTNTMTLYLDGSQVAQAALPNKTATGNGLPLEIGRNGTTGNYWTGLIDDVRVWNVLRTGGQIASNFSNEYIGAPTGLIGNWRFNEGSGTTANDFAGQATATLGGTAGWSTDVHGAAPPPPTATPTPPATNTPVPGTPTNTPIPQTCPCTIWPSNATPVNASNADTSAIELGVKFQSDTSGYVSGVRFYKGTTNTGAHIGNLWSSTGTLLATATFSGETASGWQQVNFSSPVAITANTTYIASYHTDTGGYAADQNALASSVDRAPLHATSSGSSGGNGVYRYGATGFPTSTYNATNYWVDLVFSTSVAPTSTPTLTPTPTNTPTPGPTNTPTATPPATNTPVPANCPCTIWANTAAPVNASNADGSAIEVGVKFRADQNGFITGLRFYKGSANTGTHTGHLWTSTGTLLATATFTGETASGWQQVTLSTPVAVTANTTYVASYHTDVGGYAADQTGLTSSVDNGPLHALASGTSGGNGVYMYGATSAFPSNSFNATNYWVDVVFNTTAQLPTATPTPTATNTPPPQTCPCTLFPSNAVPAVVSNADPNALELGMKFRPDVNGRITGVRFYKSSTNTGTHIAHLWSSTGTSLATATFSGETASGWQQVNFTTPVAVTANTTYVVSYHTDTGNYSADQSYFTNSVDRSPLHAPSSGTSGGNGVYMYSANSVFPTNTYNATNYWVDVVFVSP